jgi:hypothetical protein
MAKVRLNSTLSGLSGKVDGWVFRQQDGRTIVQAHRASANPPSAEQQSGRDRFRAAQTYAAGVLADPFKRAVYQKLGAARKRPPNTLLISNFLTPPTLECIELGGYNGHPGHSIQVEAIDAIEVVEVMIVIRDSAGGQVESGPAAKDHGVWQYQTTATVPANLRWQLEITARNRARAEIIQIVHPGLA